MIKNFVFDMGGVLIDVGKLFESEKKIDPEIYSDHMIGKIDCNDVREHLISKYTESSEEILKIFTAEHYRQISKVKKEMIILIRQLKKYGYQNFILSNATKDYVDFVKRNFNFLEDVNDYVFSCDAGLRKPDREIFEFAILKFAIIPEETIYVDDLPANVKAAENLGFKGIIFEDCKQLQSEINKIFIETKEVKISPENVVQDKMQDKFR